VLKGQLEETRANLKGQIEVNLKLEKQLEMARSEASKLTEGLQDIKHLLE
jgi:hypothetical protein